MERSWWIVLVLICNLAYGQINSGAIGNNRFLQRTNPQITRALNDGGSSLDHPEVQKLARKIVDLGLWGNLKLWVDEDLLKERVSGSNIFIPKAYDISGQVNDSGQTDTLRQPKLDTIGMLFDGLNDYLSNSVSINSFPFTVNFYFKSTSASAAFRDFFSLGYNLNINEFIQIQLNSAQKISFNIRTIDVSNQNTITSPLTYNDGNWYMVTGVAVNYGNTLLYINSSLVASSNTTNYAFPTVNTQTIGALSRISISNYINAKIGSLQIFDTNLSATQIDAIFQETRGKYGI